MTDALRGISVLVTRPSHQADNLVKLIESHGGEALRFPTLQIEANADRDAVLETIGDIAAYDVAIFISINAVSHGVQYLPSEGRRPLLAAIGPSTSRALSDAGFSTDIKATQGFTSEALLREPALTDVGGKKIVIFRGSGGRALLGRELERRGASVTYAEVYRRDRPDVLDPEIESRLAAGTIDVITATSAETLFNLYELAAEPTVTELTRTQLVTTSERVVEKATALGFEREAVLATGPDDQAVVDAILDWRHSNKPADIATETVMTGRERNESIVESVINKELDMNSADNKSESEAARDGADSIVVEATVDEPRAAAASTAAPVKRGGGALSLLAILLSLAALAASGYVWWEQQQAVNASAQTLDATGDAIATAEQEIAALGGRLDRNMARLSSLDAGRGRFESSMDDLRSSVETLTSRVQGTEQSIDAVSGVSASARSSWVRAEAEYYLQAANSRLQLARDPAAALAALEAADDRLKSLGDPTLYRVRQELAGEIAALKAVPRPDMEGIAHTLNGLAAQVEELPLANSSPDSYTASPDGNDGETQSGLDRAVSTLSGVFTSMVSVKRTNEEATPLLSRDEEFFLKRNLELQLQTARLALLRGEPSNYRESLRTARNWVETHFVTDSSAVRSVIATMTELEREDISPALPDISGSLRLLRLSAPAANAISDRPPSSIAPPDPSDNAAPAGESEGAA